jgi:hypothetical protein
VSRRESVPQWFFNRGTKGMNKKICLVGFAILVAMSWKICPVFAAAVEDRASKDAGNASPGKSKPIALDEDDLQDESSPRIMVVVPETLLGRQRVPDPAGETELIRRLVESNLRVLDASEVARIRYSEEMGHIIKEADVKAMKALCKRYHCDLFIAGEAFSEQVNVQPARDAGPVQARARIEVKAFVVGTGEIIAANAASAGATDLSPAVAGKTALQNAATELAEYLVPRVKTAIQQGRVAQAVQQPPYLLYGVAAAMALVVLVALVLAVLFQRRGAAAETAQPADSRLSGQTTHK